MDIDLTSKSVHRDKVIMDQPAAPGERAQPGNGDRPEMRPEVISYPLVVAWLDSDNCVAHYQSRGMDLLECAFRGAHAP
jgi:hypothetical protein